MVLVGLSLLALTFGLGAWLGAPYLPILRRDAEPLLDLANLKPGQTIIDLGSGDGRLLRAAARRGARGIGYEINPVLWLISMAVCWRYRRQVTLKLANFWRVTLPSADVVYVFLIDRYMAQLEKKLSQELRTPTTVVSFVFALPTRHHSASTATAWLYRFGDVPAVAKGNLKR